MTIMSGTIATGGSAITTIGCRHIIMNGWSIMTSTSTEAVEPPSEPGQGQACYHSVSVIFLAAGSYGGAGLF